MDHDLLMARLKQHVADGRVVSLVQDWLDAGLMQAGPPLAFNLAAIPRKQKAARLVRRGADLVLGAVAQQINPYTDYEPDYTADRFEVGEEAQNGEGLPGESTASLYLPMRQAAIRQVVSGGLLLGLGVIKSGFTKLAPKVGEAMKTALATPAGRRLLKKSALVTGGLAGAAVLAAAAAYLLNRKAGKAPTGVLQGSPLSPLLANIYLHPFDVSLTQSSYHPARFADDWVILCPHEETAEAAYNDAVRALARLRLRVNPDKTRILRPEERLEWLGVVIK